ncbi:MAG: hypothetical protein O2894_07615 [Planctomycetota bacterium]|nr:hypothetical protein [Planctomycetota bacterium]
MTNPNDGDDPFELVEDEGPTRPLAPPPPEPADEPISDVPEIKIEPEPPAKPKAKAPPGPSDGSTVRMSLADVVSAWQEDAPVAEAAAAVPMKKDRTRAKMIAVATIVALAVLAVIVVFVA